MHRVLLAEDYRLNQIVVAGTLSKLGYEVEIVDGGLPAVEACRHEDFAAILMDVMMPDLDGYETAARIRAMEGDREIALAAGFNDYLTKPLRELELKDALERWIGAPVVLHRAPARPFGASMVRSASKWAILVRGARRPVSDVRSPDVRVPAV